MPGSLRHAAGTHRMKSRPFACVAALLWPLLVPSFAAETAAPAEAAAPATPPTDAATPAASSAKADLSALIGRIQTKLQAGKTTEAELADELKEFDALRAKYAAEKTDEVARIGFMKAMLYIQIFEKQDTGIALLREVVKDFPGTQAAEQIPQTIAQIEAKAAAEAATAVGKPFPPFKETSADGTVIDLAAYRGKIVLIDFWATWCGPCVAELPHVREAYEKYHAQGFEIIGVSLDKEADKLAAFTKENKMTWLQYFDGQGWKNKLAQTYGINSIPATFLLDGEGKIVAKGLRGEALAQKLAELLPAPKP